MLRFLTDQNFDHDILRGLVRLVPDLDIVTTQRAGLARMDDPAVLAWAARESRIVLTHDVSTMTRYAYDRVRAGEPMPGVFEVGRAVPVGVAVDDLSLLATCSLDGEWDGHVIHPPLRR